MQIYLVTRSTQPEEAMTSGAMDVPATQESESRSDEKVEEGE